MAIIMENTLREVAAETLKLLGVFERLRIESADGGGKWAKVDEYLKRNGPRGTVLHLRKGAVIFTQGDLADSAYFVYTGWIKLTVASSTGKTATVALHRHGDFVGMECLTIVQPLRLSTAKALTSCTLLRIDKGEMLRAIKQETSFASIVLSFLVNCCILMQADLVDHTFNSSEKRLARILWLLTSDREGESALPHITHEALAEMVGTTRSRITFFMNSFRKQGYVGYGRALRVHRSILNVLLRD